MHVFWGNKFNECKSQNMLGAWKLSAVLDTTTKTNEALEAGMNNLVTNLITNIYEHVMQNYVSKHLGYTARYDDIQSRDLFNLESNCTQAPM
jgi:hypothetical protein